MARDTVDAELITDRGQLISWFEQGFKPRDMWRIGTEHEKFGFHVKDRTPVSYDEPGGIRDLLRGLERNEGWDAIMDHDAIIGLYDPSKGGAISLEPGGQFELSGAPLADIHATSAELDAHFAALRPLTEPKGIRFLGMGASPVWSRAETPVMPKSRYAIMTNYMPKVGTRGLDMMYRTSTVQVNLDYADAADMGAKMRVSLALQPLATALFAASPFMDGKATGATSTRSDIWRDTDRNRTGMLPFAFKPDFGFGDYVDWALDIPMYFIKRGATYHDATDITFRQFMAGAARDRLPGVVPEIGDWTNHLGTLFPEARLKRYIEQRGADAGPRSHLLALPAFWVGLLYDPVVLDLVERLTSDWSMAEMLQMRDQVPHHGLKTMIAGRSLHELARDVLALSAQGLAERGRRNAAGDDERIYLEPLKDIVDTGLTLADHMLAAHAEMGDHYLKALFDDFAY